MSRSASVTVTNIILLECVLHHCVATCLPYWHANSSKVRNSQSVIEMQEEWKQLTYLFVKTLQQDVQCMKSCPDPSWETKFGNNSRWRMLWSLKGGGCWWLIQHGWGMKSHVDKILAFKKTGVLHFWPKITGGSGILASILALLLQG